MAQLCASWTTAPLKPRMPSTPFCQHLKHGHAQESSSITEVLQPPTSAVFTAHRKDSTPMEGRPGQARNDRRNPGSALTALLTQSILPVQGEAVIVQDLLRQRGSGVMLAALACVQGASARALHDGEVGADIRLHLHAERSVGGACMPPVRRGVTPWAA